MSTSTSTPPSSSTSSSSSSASSSVEMYPDSPVIDQGFLTVSNVHKIFYQVFGVNEDNAPSALFLHGGPAAGCDPKRSHRFFDPKFYKIVVFDQRGCGRSEPNAGSSAISLAMTDNNTWTLVDDIDHLRRHLNIKHWTTILGGSWGATLALAYSQSHPSFVKSLVLRGVFLFLQEDMDWLFEFGGASSMYPDAFERYASFIPVDEQSSMISAYYKRLTSNDEELRCEAARRFVEWELTISRVHVSKEHIDSVLQDARRFAPFALFECVFFKDKGYLRPNQLLESCHLISHIPCHIVHGRQDVVCRPAGAWKLHKCMKNSTVQFIPDAGHSDSEPGIEAALIQATDNMKKHC